MASFREVAVVGAGTMGSGIAYTMACGGLGVTLIDATCDRARAGRNRVEALLGEALIRGRMDESAAAEALGRVRVGGCLTDARDADLVVEAIVEEPNLKQDVFARLDEICRPDAVLATNTNALLVADMAGATVVPERVLGMHYLYPAAKNRLVELVGHAATGEAALSSVRMLAERLGKETVVAADAPGFVVNRMLLPWLIEAVRIHEEGTSIAAVEATACQAFGAVRGPFALMNFVGASAVLRASLSLGRRLGRLYVAPPMLRRHVESEATWDGVAIAGAVPMPRIADRLWGAVLHAVAGLVSEGVGTLATAALAARSGLRWRIDPAQQTVRLGFHRTVELAASVERRYGLTTPALLTDESRFATALAPAMALAR